MTKVFVNRTLNLRKVKYIGLDMDHTLIRYNSRAFEELSHGTMLEKLVTNLQYPSGIRKIHFDYDLAIRGLVIDKRHGNLLKVSRHGAIRASFHGVKPIDYRHQQAIYKSIYIDLSDPNYISIDTAFSIAIATLFAQLVELKDAGTYPLPEYTKLAEDLMNVLDESHRDGSLKNIVRAGLDRFVIKEAAVVEGLERYRKHGKKIFILTNSEFEYTKLLLDYAINPFLKDFKHWQDLFEFVITSAQKPRFFYDNLRFFKINPSDGTMKAVDEKLERGIYYGGCASKFTTDLQLEGDDILYIGDHIYGDILRLKKDCNWRTAMVIEELDDEIRKNEMAKPLQNEITGLMEQKEPFEQSIVDLTSASIEVGKKPDESRILDLQNKIAEVDQKIGKLIKQQQVVYNAYWGEVMRAGNEESYFAHQVDRFACIYMVKLADILELSPRTYFRARRRPLAHEIGPF